MRSLDGVVVLDITRVVAGPFCSMLLADLGATVIKIEHPDEPDYARTFPPFLDPEEPGAGESAGAEKLSGFFAQFNRNKQGLTLNLRHDAGKETLRALARRADILIENFRPGTMDKLGVGFDVLHEVNPRLVYAALSGYGQTGPNRLRPSYDNTAQASGGLWSMNGEKGHAPIRVGTIIGDLSASFYGAIGVLAALRHAERTGEGQLVDISQQDAVVSLTENAVVSYTVDGTIPVPLGNEHPFVRPYELFPCADGFVFFGGYTDKFWALSCELFGDGTPVDETLATMAHRFDEKTYEGLVRPLIETWFRDRTKAELEAIAGDQVPLTAIKDIAEVVADPQIAARGMIADVAYPGYGSLRTVGSPMKLSGTPVVVDGTAPGVGEHTDAVLAEYGGLDPRQIAGLRDAGTVL
jgi:CoA:oxalate CoA-transferase